MDYFITNIENISAGEDLVTISYSKFGLIEIKNSMLDDSLEIVRGRIDEVGTKEPTIIRRGNDRILIELPGLDDPNRIKNLLGKTANLTFRLVSETEDSFGSELLFYEDGEKRYIIAPAGVKVGQNVISGESVPIEDGNAMPLSVMPLGSSVHCVELYAGRGAQMVRSAGASAQVMAKEGDYVALKLPSTEVRLVRKECYATLGEVGNSEIRNTSLGKAGRRRWLGRRPQVRGSVMNPCDHPHGGGEGKAPIGRAGPVTPWGKPALGLKTRKKNKPSNKLVVRRRRRVSKRSRGGRDS